MGGSYRTPIKITTGGEEIKTFNNRMLFGVLPTVKNTEDISKPSFSCQSTGGYARASGVGDRQSTGG